MIKSILKSVLLVAYISIMYVGFNVAGNTGKDLNTAHCGVLLCGLIAGGSLIIKDSEKD